MKIKYLITLWAAIAIVGSYMLGYTPLLLSVVYLLISALTYVIYVKDKSAAKSKAWRTPEKTLQLLSLCGGWLGAVLAQEALRHKTQKTSFQVVFWLTVVINMAGFAVLHLEPLSSTSKQMMLQIGSALESKNGTELPLSKLAILFQYTR